jgi:hypothetical protein
VRIAAAAKPRPIELFDVGSSAGLNLVGDQLQGIWESQDGARLDVEPTMPIVRRTGFDLRPLDVLDEEDARWLKACVWPGDRDREKRLEDAIAAFRRLQLDSSAPRVERARPAVLGPGPLRAAPTSHRCGCAGGF